MIKLIVAMTKDRVIADKGAIPWRYTEDLRRFRRMTMGCTVVMGRKTWDTIPDYYKPLTGRLNMVLSRSRTDMQQYDFPSVLLFNGLEEAMGFCESHLPKERDTWIMGGAEIYREALENTKINVEHLDIVTVPDNIPLQDATLFPEINWEEWVQTSHYKSGELVIETYRKA